MAGASPELLCSRCSSKADPLAWQCGPCGGPLAIANPLPFDATSLQDTEWSLWRYAAMLPTPRNFSLGEGFTPLTQVEINGVEFFAKLEYLAPTASYKDRGTAILVNHLVAHGVEAVVEDSSGNAGASLAAYAGAAGIEVRIFVPAHAAEGKKQQIRAFGAELVEVEGARGAATEACRAAAATSVYASHAWSPFFLAGQQTCAWELWEQLGRRAPEVVVLPVGQGGLLLGLWHGFVALRRAGLIDAVPRLIGVQAAACAPIVCAWSAKEAAPAAVTEGETIAGGIRVADPVRGPEILRAIRASDGVAISVDDAAILAAQRVLAHHGLFVEPTSAAPVAALARVRAMVGSRAEIVVPLTGSGLKAPA